MIVDDSLRALVRRWLEAGLTEAQVVQHAIRQTGCYPGHVTGQFVRDRYTIAEAVRWAVRDIAARKARADMEAELRAMGRLHKKDFE